jgi:hypothetical protein
MNVLLGAMPTEDAPFTESMLMWRVAWWGAAFAFVFGGYMGASLSHDKGDGPLIAFLMGLGLGMGTGLFVGAASGFIYGWTTPLYDVAPSATFGTGLGYGLVGALIGPLGGIAGGGIGGFLLWFVPGRRS